MELVSDFAACSAIPRRSCARASYLFVAPSSSLEGLTGLYGVKGAALGLRDLGNAGRQ